MNRQKFMTFCSIFLLVGALIAAFPVQTLAQSIEEIPRTAANIQYAEVSRVQEAESPRLVHRFLQTFVKIEVLPITLKILALSTGNPLKTCLHNFVGQSPC